MVRTNDFVATHFNAASRIHEICEQQGFSPDDARVFTYIHFRLIKNVGNSNLSHEETAQVIDFIKNKEKNRSIGPQLCFISQKINRLDTDIRDSFGMEYRIGSELDNRARLHRDTNYRERMMKMYRERIEPELR
jgi:hypothetical protein